MSDDNYYTPVRHCLEGARNGSFCAGAEEAAATIKGLQDRLDAALAELRQCYRDDGCTEQEVEDQVSRFSL